MAHTVRTHDDIPDAPKRQSSLALLGWAFLGSLVGAALVYGFTAARGASPLTRVGIPVARPPGSVRTWSSLQALSAGHTGPTVTLSTVPSGPGVIGIGSLSGLRGEVAIVRGTTWLAIALPGDAVRHQRSNASDETATFLAVADVPEWQSQSFTSPVVFDALAGELERRVNEAGLDVTGPIPLTIEGPLSAVNFNVVNGPRLGNDTPTEERLAEIAIRASAPSATGTLVGFFAARGDERLIHPGERMHLHVVLPSTGQVGHLDGATVGSGAVLRLPRRAEMRTRDIQP
jgi:hypothetical protein